MIRNDRNVGWLLSLGDEFKSNLQVVICSYNQTDNSLTTIVPNYHEPLSGEKEQMDNQRSSNKMMPHWPALHVFVEYVWNFCKGDVHEILIGEASWKNKLKTCFLSMSKDTPPRTSMAPENGPLKREIPIGNLFFSGTGVHVIFLGVKLQSIQHLYPRKSTTI